MLAHPVACVRHPFNLSTDSQRLPGSGISNASTYLVDPPDTRRGDEKETGKRFLLYFALGWDSREQQPQHFRVFMNICDRREVKTRLANGAHRPFLILNVYKTNK